MNNPIQIYNELRDTYLKYISSGIPFFNEQYDAERKRTTERKWHNMPTSYH